VMRSRDEVLREIKDLESEMKRAAKDLDFERAAELRDKILALRRSIA
jgi:excinuclease ABC subunit B